MRRYLSLEQVQRKSEKSRDLMEWMPLPTAS